MNKKQSMGLGGVLLVVFVILKLVGVIGWSWWWVLSPLWIPAAASILITALFLGVRVAAIMTSKKKKAKK